MALDYTAIASYGAYPTPTPTSTRRAALACSHGLLNITLPSPIAVTGKAVVNLGKRLMTIGGRAITLGIGKILSFKR